MASCFKIQKRIHGLFQKALKKFSDDEELWLEYFKWAQSKGSSKRLGSTFTRYVINFSKDCKYLDICAHRLVVLCRALQLHPKNVMFWILAASWEFESNAHVSTARKIFQQGLRINGNNEKLWIEYFKMELLYTEKIRLRQEYLTSAAVAEMQEVHEVNCLPFLYLFKQRWDTHSSFPIYKQADEDNDKQETTKTINTLSILRPVYENAVKGIHYVGLFKSLTII